MRIERWYWLLVFCVVSLGLHLALLAKSRYLHTPIPPRPPVREIEIALEPPPEPKAPPPAVAPTPKPAPVATPADRRVVKQAIAAAARVQPAFPTAVKPLNPALPVPVKAMPPARTTQGGVDPLKDERPTSFGLPSAPRNAPAPRLPTARLTLNPGGGGSPAPSTIPGGRGGAAGPEAPPDTLVWNGGGRGGANLPKEAPAIGGGGGRSILSVSNPLGTPVPDERPGLGPGVGGGQGVGAGSGAGAGRGAGIGALPGGRQAIASLSRRRGPGIGDAAGSGIGSRAPGGGRGISAELPGTGGTGIGYGRGSGTGYGSGSGVGVGDGDGGAPPGRVRGVPFGDLAGLLKGGKGPGGGVGGGPGGPGRGVVFSPALPGGGSGGGAVRIVYLLDSSGSMRDGNKIGKAKDALKKALSELTPRDSFNIIHFDKDIYQFADSLQKASPANVKRGLDYVDAIQLNDFTRMSDAIASGLAMPGVTHMFVLSDGEPHGGIEDFGQLRQMVRDRNQGRVHINTLALGLGEQFKGMALLKAIAEENSGAFAYVNLAK